MANVATQFLELVDTHASVEWVDMAGDEGSLVIPFTFRVPTPMSQGCTGLLGHATCYPPSLTVGTRRLRINSTSSRAHGSVRYQVVAQLFQGEREILCYLVDIGVTNVSLENPPPVSVDDFPGEYKCSNGKSIRSPPIIKTWRFSRPCSAQSRMRLAVTIREPKVMNLGTSRQQGKEHYMSLDALFHLHQASTSADEASKQPDEMHVTISWLLESTTFVSVVPLYELPTLQDAIADPYIAAAATSTPLRTIKLVLRDWTSCDGGGAAPCPTGSQSVRKRRFILTTAPIEFESHWHRHERLFLPLTELTEGSTTFSTPYLSRRHTIQLQLEGCRHGATAVRLRLAVPLQIFKIRPPNELTEAHASPARQSPLVASPVYVR